MSLSNQAAARVAVVTGGHSYDVVNFHKLFRSLPEADVYVQHMDDYAASSTEVRAAYDVVVFYSMLTETPPEKGLPWYCGKPKQAIEELGRPGQGIVILHHAILAYLDWPLWAGLVGINDRKFTYHFNQQVNVKVPGASHPIVRGLGPWTMTDETYLMADAGEGCQVLLTTDHPKSLKTLAWTREHRGSRVFVFQCGHDNAAWANEDFREVLRRGIFWSAGRS